MRPVRRGAAANSPRHVFFRFNSKIGWQLLEAAMSSATSRRPGVPKPMCEQSNCTVCAMMDEKIFKRDWCFEWLRHLKDFEVSQELAEKDRQVVLMVKNSDNEVRHIRSRLAVLQTQTVSNLAKQDVSLLCILTLFLNSLSGQ